MPYTKYQIHDERYPHFITCSVVDGIPIFSMPECAEIILNSLGFLRDERQIKIIAYVIMENHLHAILYGENLKRQIAAFRSYTARCVVDILRHNHHKIWLNRFGGIVKSYRKDRSHQIWRASYHPLQLYFDEMLIQKINYIHNNPVKRGYVNEAHHWRYSSAGNYLGHAGLIEIDPAEWL